jgi:hypothetical protein
MVSVRAIILTGAACALRARRGAALAALLCLAGVGSAQAAHSPPDVCASATSCTLTLTKSNVSSIGTGNFGTVNLSLNLLTNTATIDVKLVDGSGSICRRPSQRLAAGTRRSRCCVAC